MNEGDFSSAATGAAALAALPGQRSFAIIEAIPGVIIGYPARVHEYPDSESRVIKQVQQSDKVTVIIIHGDWYGVILLDNTIGYVFRDLVDLESNSKQEQEATEVERSLANLPQEPLAAVPHSTEPRTKSTTKSATELQSAPTDLRTTIDEMAGNIAEQQPEFRSFAFQCRSDLRQCRMDFA